MAPNHRIVPIEVVVSDSTGLVGLYLISAVGLLVTVGLFLREWTVNWTTLAFTARGRDR